MIRESCSSPIPVLFYFSWGGIWAFVLVHTEPFCKSDWLHIELCVQPLWFERNCVFQNKARRAEKGEAQLYEALCPSSGCGGSPRLHILVSWLLCLQQFPNCFFFKVGVSLGEFLPYGCWLCLAIFFKNFFFCLELCLWIISKTIFLVILAIRQN